MQDWRLTRSERLLDMELLDRVEQRSAVDAWIVRLSDGRKARLFLFSPKATRQLAPFPGDRSTVADPHPRVMTLFDLGLVSRSGGDCAYVVLQWTDARPLSDFMDRGSGWDRSTAQQRAVTLVLSVARILAALEADEANRAGWIPGHLNPDTVWLDRQGDALLEHPLLAQSLSELQSLSLKSASKYLGYMSPEQVGGRPLDMRSDLFSFAVLVYELLTGKRLFAGESRSRIVAQVKQAEVAPLSQLCPWIEERFSSRIMQALQRDVDARPKSWARWLDELISVSDGRIPASLADQPKTEALPGPSRFIGVGSGRSVGEDHPNDVEKTGSKRAFVSTGRSGPRGPMTGMDGGPHGRDRTMEAALHPDLMTNPTGVTALRSVVETDDGGIGRWRRWGWELGLGLVVILALGFYFVTVGRGKSALTKGNDAAGRKGQTESNEVWRILRRSKGNLGKDLLFVSGKSQGAGPSLMVGTRCFQPLFWYRSRKAGWVSVFSVPGHMAKIHLGDCSK